LLLNVLIFEFLEKNMKALKLLAALSALFLVAACETAPTDGSNTDGTGAGGAGEYGSNRGAPGSKGTQWDLENNVGDRVFFELNSSVVSSEGQRTLERQAAWLKQYPNVKLVVEGHADERGTREYNIALGERRATAVKNVLTGLGVDSSRLSTISYGKERPAVLGSSEDSWAQNRRGVSVVE
jgi:peptidoglycan-associated lipoprotein